MSLPAPELDDRRFQDIVDEAKRKIARECPEWTAHNVSDPGVALIELFAWMTEMMLYRLNQVPDRLYVKFLELIGIELFSSVPARADLLFELAAPQVDAVRIPAGTQVSTERVGSDTPVVFMTDEAIALTAPRLVACLTRTRDRYEDHWDDLQLPGRRLRCFPSLEAGDALYLGFADSLGSHLLRLDVVTGPEGAGVDPQRPPRVWETWDGREWQPARILRDSSAGFNDDGELVLLLAGEHGSLDLGGTRAHWLRCKLMAPEEGQPNYRRSPEVDSVAAAGLGGRVAAHHAEPASGELLGTSTGEPGQVFEVRRAPVLPRRDGETVRVVLPRADVRADVVVEDWQEVADFADSTAGDRVFTWSGSSGEIRFGPRIVERDGAVRQHGATPPIDAEVHVTGYRYGGGRRGNVGARSLTVLRTSIPSVATVTNLDPATGGVDPETVANARQRGPLYLRGGQRAVTAADFERLALEAAPGVARARCLPPAAPGEPVRLLIVPHVDIAPQALALDDLALSQEMVDAIKAYLDVRRLLTTRVRIETPLYQGVKVVAVVQAPPGRRPETIRERAEAALHQYINPLVGGFDGKGWPFGADLSAFDIPKLLGAALGDVTVRQVDLFAADLERRQEREDQVHQTMRLSPGALFMSFRHVVVVQQ